MTDANLMDADCIHGIPWYDCDECIPPRPSLAELLTDTEFEDWLNDE